MFTILSSLSRHFYSPHALVLDITFALYQIFFIIQDGSTPLVVASQRGYTDIVKLLLEAGATVDATCEVSPRTSLHVLIILDYIKQDFCLRWTNQWYLSSIFVVLYIQLSCIWWQFDGNTALTLASHVGDADIVRLLLDAGADLDCQEDVCHSTNIIIIITYTLKYSFL